jgi:hypothetical protein
MKQSDLTPTTPIYFDNQIADGRRIIENARKLKAKSK